jgi:hypothetical protein
MKDLNNSFFNFKEELKKFLSWFLIKNEVESFGNIEDQ